MDNVENDPPCASGEINRTQGAPGPGSAWVAQRELHRLQVGERGLRRPEGRFQELRRIRVHRFRGLAGHAIHILQAAFDNRVRMAVAD